jgi:hypothetical protein
VRAIRCSNEFLKSEMVAESMKQSMGFGADFTEYRFAVSVCADGPMYRQPNCQEECGWTREQWKLGTDLCIN